MSKSRFDPVPSETSTTELVEAGEVVLASTG